MPTRTLRVVLALLLTISGITLLTTPARAATTQPLTVRVLLVSCVADCDEAGLEALGESTPDFYAEITYAGFPVHTTPRAPDDRSQIAPFWTLTQQIPTTVVDQEISVLIKDHDSTSGDDWADTSPRAGDPFTRFTVNMIDGEVTGDLTGTGCVAGNGEPGGGVFGADPKPSVQLCLEISPGPGFDSDADGFSDWEEYRGRDFDGDDVVDMTLPDADPNRRDLYVELDYMTGHKPLDDAVADVENAFDVAPVTNPNTGATGINLHLLVNEEVPAADELDFADYSDPGDRPSGTYDDFDDLKSGNPAKPCGDGNTARFMTAADRSSPHCQDILSFKRQKFRYGVFIDELLGGGTVSGRAELHERGGNDFVVSLGGWDGFGDVGGQRAAEAGTLMHELGHTLGLAHGGRRDNGTLDEVNCKPNYQSVMNYIWQFPRYDSGRPLSYSRLTGSTLVENQLDETRNPGISGLVRDVFFTTPDPRGDVDRNGVLDDMVWNRANPQFKIDWNMDGDTNDNPVTMNVNRFPWLGGDCGFAKVDETMVGHTDWDRLVYDFTSSPRFSDGAHGPMPDELDYTEMTRSASPDLKAALAFDKAQAAPGETVTATATLTNQGAVASENTTVTVDGATRQLPPLGWAAEAFTSTVPCEAADGTTRQSTATVTASNENAALRADNTATAAYTVRAPKVTTSVAATPSVKAGETVTYTVTYKNEGGSAASGARLTFTPPPGVHTTGPLTRDLGTLTPGQQGTVTFTGRPSLLTEAGTLQASAKVSYGSNACAYEASGSAATTVTVQAPSRDPMPPALWALRGDLQTAEVLARVHATDQRFDTGGDGTLSRQETGSAFLLPVLQPRQLRAEMLATLLNLGTRRINAGTRVETVTIRRLGLNTVGDAVRYAQATLTQSPSLQNVIRYTDATLALTEINSGIAERY
ncbi:DUF11 domain-containing protein [Herbidospora sp. NEAU-GS84]|uniref:DUF11 domain-containing protein n=1 Tax=Herbidospora solisilvae TaxID=2696284 RepID=A0A7C9NHQ5_9ACTN|nr:DUF11 domain-containing protein [Herbidospora solisilvae]NAS22852.1 DUF11 domain-containing protein [Herbidospora solisilvae]